MESRMNEFRAFVNKYPKLRDEVRNGKKTWQNIYEEWVLFGEENFGNYKDEDIQNIKKAVANSNLNLDSVKNVINYIKKINPDDLNKTLNTVQKVIQIAQTVGGNKVGSVAPLIGSAYSDWWD